MGLVKTSITIPDEIFRQAKAMSENFSQVVAEALKEYLQKRKVQKAKGSFGSWGMRDKDSVDIVNELRKEGERNYADRNH
jgi:predicted CopG family antitoxin